MRPEVLPTLREWRRVLRAGGKLYVAVPDFKALAELYAWDDVSLWRLIGLLCGRQDYPENTHYSAYDYEYLAWLLAESGFHSIRRWEQDWFPNPNDDYSRAEIDGTPVSLNVEAVRGA